MACSILESCYRRSGQIFLRSASVLFQIIAETFQPEAFGELIVGTVMLCICGVRCNISWNFELVLMLVVATIFGALIITAIKIFATSFDFLIKRSGYIVQILYNFINYAKYPIGIYPKIIKAILEFLLPFGLAISMSVETLMFGTYNIYLLCLKIICTAFVFLGISIFIWTKCIKKYESTGS